MYLNLNVFCNKCGREKNYVHYNQNPETCEFCGSDWIVKQIQSPYVDCKPGKNAKKK